MHHPHFLQVASSQIKVDFLAVSFHHSFPATRMRWTPAYNSVIKAI
jgi:hypothetical protein